jgi:hypothetical protein
MRSMAFALVWPVLCLFSSQCLGDGMGFVISEDTQALQPVSEHEQRATIAFKNNIEHMIIAVSLDLAHESNGVWLFPVRGEPKQIKIRLADKYPDFEGHDLYRTASKKLSTFNLVLNISQLWTLPSLALTRSGTIIRSLGSDTSDETVVRGMQVDSWGMHAEVLGAGSVSELLEYFEKRNLKISENELESFQDYLNNGHSIIAVWMSSRQTALKEFSGYSRSGNIKERRPCVYVQFPSAEPFFPLKPTSAYGRSEITMLLTVMGQWKPCFQWQPEYYLQEKMDANLPKEFTAVSGQSNVCYTFVRHDSDAYRLQYDLVFKDAHTASMNTAVLLAKTPEWFIVVIAIGAIAVLSYFCGGVLGVLFAISWKNGSRLGLWNLLSIVGLAVAATVSRPGQILGVYPLKRACFVGAFSILFVITSFLPACFAEMLLRGRSEALFDFTGLLVALLFLTVFFSLSAIVWAPILLRGYLLGKDKERIARLDAELEETVRIARKNKKT